jgi:folylpolyglutamate synthase/dihydropteroate synthase
VVVIDNVPAAVAWAIEATPPDGQVVITGSLYVVSPARAFLVPASG